MKSNPLKATKTAKQAGQENAIELKARLEKLELEELTKKKEALQKYLDENKIEIVPCVVLNVGQQQVTFELQKLINGIPAYFIRPK